MEHPFKDSEVLLCAVPQPGGEGSWHKMLQEFLSTLRWNSKSLSCLRRYRHSLSFFTVVLMCWDGLSQVFENVHSFHLRATDGKWMEVCCFLLKSTIGSFVLHMFSRRWFSWHQSEALSWYWSLRWLQNHGWSTAEGWAPITGEIQYWGWEAKQCDTEQVQ